MKPKLNEIHYLHDEQIEKTGPDASTPEPEYEQEQQDNTRVELVNGNKKPEQRGRRVPEKAWKKCKIKSIADLANEEIDKSLYLLGDGWLERGSGGFVVAGSGVGKSVLSFQMGILWACGREAFGIETSNGPLKIAIFQAEDGENDQRRMSKMFNNLGLTEKQKELSRDNCRVITCNDLHGVGFLEMVEGYLEDNSTDLLMLNPLNSYLEGAAVDEEIAKEFLRIKLNPILSRHKVGCLIMHHTPKQNYRDTSNWHHAAFMYAMAGHADLTNWARAVVVIEPSQNDPRVFEFIAAKRGQLIGWDEIRRYWAHADKGKPWMWIEADEKTVEIANTPKNVITADHIKEILKGRVDPVHKDEIITKARAKGFKNQDEFNAALKDGEGRLFFKDIIRDGGAQKRFGFVINEPLYDIPGDIFSLIPNEGGIKPDDLTKRAKKEHGYFSDEVDEAVKTLKTQGKIEYLAGEGREWAKKTLARTCAPSLVFGFAPSGELTTVTVTSDPTAWLGR